MTDRVSALAVEGRAKECGAPGRRSVTRTRRDRAPERAQAQSIRLWGGFGEARIARVRVGKMPPRRRPPAPELELLLRRDLVGVLPRLRRVVPHASPSRPRRRRRRALPMIRRGPGGASRAGPGQLPPVPPPFEPPAPPRGTGAAAAAAAAAARAARRGGRPCRRPWPRRPRPRRPRPRRSRPRRRCAAAAPRRRSPPPAARDARRRPVPREHVAHNLSAFRARPTRAAAFAPRPARGLGAGVFARAPTAPSTGSST